ncbi:MAG TPA: PKD domain-containing protein, partial [Prolixibacteraceae bacterium]|nr:PKD domain-containing protein [Prolixibacteraceae bacterium]
ISGMKVSFSQNYIPGEDELRLQGSVGTISSFWSSSQGFLTLTGSSDINEYIQAIRQVVYSNNSSIATTGNRSLTFSLDDVDYLPATQHYYRFIARQGITWSTAKAEAESASMKYYGIQGYLATITSYEENAFIQQKTKGVGWIGASDQDAEGVWKWVTGPETGKQFWQGNFTGSALSGMYSNWNSGEPNNVGTTGEAYAHITFFASNPSASLKWNDLPNGGGNGEYYPAGYLVEYGGTPGDPIVNLSASITLMIKSVSFSTSRIFTKCQGDPVQLNQADNEAAYAWHPVSGLSNPYISNPFAKPDLTTEYTVVATNGTCRDSAKFLVNINPSPVSLLKEAEDICIGGQVTLDPGSHSGYLWGTGETTRTITRSANGLNKVTLTALNGCKTKDSVSVVVHDYPKMDLSEMNPLTCGSLSTTVNISSDKGTYILTNLTNNQQFNGTAVTVPAYGTYPFSALVTDPYGCISDTALMLRFYKIPVVNLTIDETVCYGYNLQATYIGDANPPVSRFTWIFGGDTISNNLGQSTEQIPLGVNQAKRDLVLKVTEDGCTGSNSLKDIHVIPDLKLSVKDSLQCQPETFEFSATNTETVVQYDWDWGDGTVGTGKNAVHKYAGDGYYDVSLEVTTDKGCMNSATIEKMVYVAPVPTAGFSVTPEMCLNPGKDTLYYSGSANNMDTYYWDLSGFDPVEIIRSPDTTAGPFVFELINKPKTKLSLYVISQ